MEGVGGDASNTAAESEGEAVVEVASPHAFERALRLRVDAGRKPPLLWPATDGCCKPEAAEPEAAEGGDVRNGEEEVEAGTCPATATAEAEAEAERSGTTPTTPLVVVEEAEEEREGEGRGRGSRGSDAMPVATASVTTNGCTPPAPAPGPAPAAPAEAVEGMGEVGSSVLAAFLEDLLPRLRLP